MRKLNRRDFIAVGAGGLAALGMHPQEDDGLIVHEWGVVTVPYGTTYSNLRTAGSKSVGGMEVDPGLPPFVVRWETALPAKFGGQEARKPILYFYSKEKKVVSLKVSVPTGVPKAWWPPADEFALQDKADGSKGMLHWKSLGIDPAAQAFRNATGWWEIARKTDAAPVVAGGAAEKFLFYDALVSYDPAVEIAWPKGGKVHLHNASAESFRHVFSIRVKDRQGYFAYHRELAAGEKVELVPEKGTPGTLADMLIEAGLYRKEAEGLVEIWREEFFWAEGTRVLMIASRESYDRLLPIEITPKPKELKRVLIVHVECLDAERQDEVVRLIEKLGADDLAERDAAAGKLKKLGPLAEPQVRAAAEKANDPELKARLQDLLKH